MLIGETLNSFKKEINSIVDLIEEKDPKFERLTDQIGAKLAAILQKTDYEMQMMLRRTIFMNKRKEKKAEIEKTQSMIKMLIEKKLVETNGKPLPELMPNFALNLQDHVIFKNFVRDVEGYIQIANKYLSYKNSEEKAKVSSY